jgi:hypothetical protein
MNLESQEHYFATQRLAKIELPPMIKGILGNTQKDRQRSRLLCMGIYERKRGQRNKGPSIYCGFSELSETFEYC